MMVLQIQTGLLVPRPAMIPLRPFCPCLCSRTLAQDLGAGPCVLLSCFRALGDLPGGSADPGGASQNVVFPPHTFPPIFKCYASTPPCSDLQQQQQQHWFFDIPICKAIKASRISKAPPIMAILSSNLVVVFICRLRYKRLYCVDLILPS